LPASARGRGARAQALGWFGFTRTSEVRTSGRFSSQKRRSRRESEDVSRCSFRRSRSRDQRFTKRMDMSSLRGRTACRSYRTQTCIFRNRCDELTNLGQWMTKYPRDAATLVSTHIGAYDDEASVLDRMHAEFIPAIGLEMDGKHHESVAQPTEVQRGPVVRRAPSASLGAVWKLSTVQIGRCYRARRSEGTTPDLPGSEVLVRFNSKSECRATRCSCTVRFLNG
jgi:hypothetical protein